MKIIAKIFGILKYIFYLCIVNKTGRHWRCREVYSALPTIVKRHILWLFHNTVYLKKDKKTALLFKVGPFGLHAVHWPLNGGNKLRGLRLRFGLWLFPLKGQEHDNKKQNENKDKETHKKVFWGEKKSYDAKLQTFFEYPSILAKINKVFFKRIYLAFGGPLLIMVLVYSFQF